MHWYIKDSTCTTECKCDVSIFRLFWWEFELCPWISQMIHFLRIGFLSPAWQRQAVLWIRGSPFHDPDFWLKCPVWKSLRSLPAILSWGERWNHTFSWLSAVGLQSTFSSDSAYLVFEPLAAVKSASWRKQRSLLSGTFSGEQSTGIGRVVGDNLRR